MNSQIKMIIDYKKDNNDELFEKIVLSFRPLFLKYINKIHKNHRDDMYQELLCTLLSVIRKFVITDYDIDNNYYKAFVNKYKIELLEISNEIKNLEYKLFCNENQFIKYLNTSLNNKIIDYYRNYKSNLLNNAISLNSYIYEDVELIETIEDKAYQKTDFFDMYNFSEKELEFLKCFLENGKVLSEEKVAKKLGISQQAVNKKKKKIIKKYIDRY